MRLLQNDTNLGVLSKFPKNDRIYTVLSLEVPERNGGDRVPFGAAAEGVQPGEPAQVDDRAEAGGRAEELVLQKSGKDTLIIIIGFTFSAPKMRSG